MKFSNLLTREAVVPLSPRHLTRMLACKQKELLRKWVILASLLFCYFHLCDPFISDHNPLCRQPVNEKDQLPEWLPKGWKVEVRTRKSGTLAGKEYKVKNILFNILFQMYILKTFYVSHSYYNFLSQFMRRSLPDWNFVIELHWPVEWEQILFQTGGSSISQNC